MKKIVSYAVAIILGALCVAPPIGYSIPLTINSFFWGYMVVISGLFGFFLLFQDIHILLKAISVFLFLDCFYSQAPAVSFNAYILVSATLYFFILCRKCDYKVITNMLVAVFWLEVSLCLVQHFGMDRLMYFGSAIKLEAGKIVNSKADMSQSRIYGGTVCQQMRLASLFCVLSPFLVFKNKWHIVPILIFSYLLGTLGFTFAVAAGILVYLILTKQITRTSFLLIVLFAVFCAFKSFSHIQVEIIEGRLPIWWVIIKSWCLDTSGPMTKHYIFASQTGPVDWVRVWLGHGIDTFLPLFPTYKHDPNPFPQAHNSHLQYLWEGGLILFVLIEAYFASLFVRLYKSEEFLLFAGCVAIWINMFFHFPDRMTQTIWLLVAFAALCEFKIREVNLGFDANEVIGC